MKTNIIKVDLIKLNEEICKFESITDKKADLIMSSRTFDSIKKACDVTWHDIDSIDTSKGRLGVYKGNDVYINDGLRYGEVNIESL